MHVHPSRTHKTSTGLIGSALLGLTLLLIFSPSAFGWGGHADAPHSGGGGVAKGVNAACNTEPLQNGTGATPTSIATANDKNGHSTWARLFVHWNNYEPSPPDRDADDYSTTITDNGNGGDSDGDGWNTTYLSALQTCVREFHDAGENVLIDLIGSPIWATTGTKLTSATDTTATGINAPNSATVNVASTATFPSSGTFVMDGVTTTYTGKTPTSFTGCGNHAATHKGELIAQTVIQVASAWGFPSSGNYPITIDSELMTVTGGQGTTTWTVTRGEYYSTIAPHSQGTKVWSVIQPPTSACLDQACYGPVAAKLVESLAGSGGVQAVEVWNEENDSNNYWHGTEHQYELLLQSAYEKLHPLRVTVVSGGATHPESYAWDQTLLRDEQRTKSLQCEHGPHGGNLSRPGYGFCFDVLGVHTYPSGSKQQRRMLVAGQAKTALNPTNSPDIYEILAGGSNGQNTLASLVSLLNSHCLGGQSTSICPTPYNMPIWITEMGAQATCTYSCGSQRSMSDWQNAEMLYNFYNYLNHARVEHCPNDVSAPCTSQNQLVHETCGQVCSRVKVALWFQDWVPSSSKVPDYSMLYNPPNQSDPADPLGNQSNGSHDFEPKCVMTAFETYVYPSPPTNPPCRQ